MNSLVLQLTAGDSSIPLPEFVSLSPRYRCEKCHEPLQGPSQTECGHRICHPCLRIFLSLGNPATCPVGEEDCAEITPNTVYPDISTRKEMRELHVYCKFRKDGCKVIIAWKLLEEHLEICAFVQVLCAAGDCQTVVCKGDLAEHQANECLYTAIPCESCGETISRGFKVEHIRDVCPEATLSCPYECGEQNITRRDLAQHQSICTNKPSDCVYKAFGCTFQGSESDIELHCERHTSGHLDNVYEHINGLQNATTQVKREIEANSIENQRLAQVSTAMTEEAHRVKQLFASQQRKIDSLLDTLNQKHKEVDDLRLEARSVQARLTDYTQSARQRYQQTDEAQRRLETRLDNAERLAVCESMAGHDNLQVEANRCQTQVVQQEQRLCELDVRFQYLESTSFDGLLIWRVDDFRRKMDDAKERRVLFSISQPFYSSSFGYKMCVKVFLNGDGMGNGTHCSLYLVLMQGLYDEILPWPFKHTVNMSLVDQRGHNDICDSFRPDPTSASFQQPRDRQTNVASGFPLFVLHATLKSESFLVDDTIFFKVKIEDSSI